MTDDRREPAPHYPSIGARRADLTVHVTALTLAIAGGIVLLALAARAGSAGLLAAVGIYAAGLTAMLAFSTAYNFAPARARPLLRRFDHAGIFLMIAGSYTPFTTQALSGAWAWGMTAAVWSVALLGVLGKLFLPMVDRRLWIAVYLGLGWLVVVALKPLLDSATWTTLMLLAGGGVLYTAGVVFHVNRRLTYARAIWHGHVTAAAGAHWAAILTGVVLAR